MANKKISELNSVTTPLAGTEEIAVVQSGETKKGIINRKYGHEISFSSNDVVLLNNQDNLVGSRIFGPITRELRNKKYEKIVSSSDRIL